MQLSDGTDSAAALQGFKHTGQEEAGLGGGGGLCWNLSPAAVLRSSGSSV